MTVAVAWSGSEGRMEENWTMDIKRAKGLPDRQTLSTILFISISPVIINFFTVCFATIPFIHFVFHLKNIKKK